jgi:hypothetical protein
VLCEVVAQAEVDGEAIGYGVRLDIMENGLATSPLKERCQSNE